MKKSLATVVTVTLNPALDMTGSLDKLMPGSVNVIDKSNLNPAGKGVNVASVLADLGANVIVTGFLGDENQDPFVQLFAQKGIEDAFIRVVGASRINVKLVESGGRVSDFNFPGVKVNDASIAALEKCLFSLAQNHDIFVIAGSLPTGISPQKVSDWIASLREKGKKVFFDTSKAALTEGLKAKPWLIKPNDEELSEWEGRPLSSKALLLEAGAKLTLTGIQNVVISRGAEGVLWGRNGHWYESKPPKMHVVSTVGAGDTLVAGMCWAELNGWPDEKSLRFATALSALAVTQVNVGVDNIKKVIQLQREINVTQLENS